MRRFPKSKALVTNRRSGSQEERGLHKPSINSGGYGERVPPVPIPNTEVKPFSADGTWLETARESRSLPDSIRKTLSIRWAFFLFHLGVPNSPGWSQPSPELTWLGESMAARSACNTAMDERPGAERAKPVSYTHLTLPTMAVV